MFDSKLTAAVSRSLESQSGSALVSIYRLSLIINPYPQRICHCSIDYRHLPYSWNLVGISLPRLGKLQMATSRRVRLHFPFIHFASISSLINSQLADSQFWFTELSFSIRSLASQPGRTFTQTTKSSSSPLTQLKKRTRCLEVRRTTRVQKNEMG